MQIEHLTKKPVLHPVKLLAEALKENTCGLSEKEVCQF
jgi:hypothetical protein